MERCNIFECRYGRHLHIRICILAVRILEDATRPLIKPSLQLYSGAKALTEGSIMKVSKLLLIPFLYCSSFLVLALGCHSPIIKDAGSLPTILRAHEHLFFYGGGADEKNTGITVRKQNPALRQGKWGFDFKSMATSVLGSQQKPISIQGYVFSYG
jgi:hypothetical protein